MNKKLRKIDIEFIRKKRKALFDLINNNDEYCTSQVLRWFWIGRNLQMIQATINESFSYEHLSNYQYHILYRWSCSLERYVSDKMVEEM